MNMTYKVILLYITCVLSTETQQSCELCHCDRIRNEAHCNGINVTTFPPFPDYIQHIYINNWRPSSLVEPVFKGLSINVNQIYITNLTTDIIKTGTFSNFKNPIDFEFNNITVWDTVQIGAFSNWSGVSYLDLNNWSVGHIVEGAFKNITITSRLKISKTHMQPFSKFAFTDVTFAHLDNYPRIELNAVTDWQEQYFKGIHGQYILIIRWTHLPLLTSSHLPVAYARMHLRYNTINGVQCGSFVSDVAYVAYHQSNEINCGAAECCLLQEDQNATATTWDDNFNSWTVPSLLNEFKCLDMQNGKPVYLRDYLLLHTNCSLAAKTTSPSRTSDVTDGSEDYGTTTEDVHFITGVTDTSCNSEDVISYKRSLIFVSCFCFILLLVIGAIIINALTNRQRSAFRLDLPLVGS